MTARGNGYRCVRALPGLAVTAVAAVTMPTAGADNSRLNDSLIGTVQSIQQRHRCPVRVENNAQLQLAARRHAEDLLTNRALAGDRGTDGSTLHDRAKAAGYHGAVAETVAMSPALAVNGVEVMNQWSERPDYVSIMSDCANTQMGVWSASNVNRTVVVAVYGKPAQVSET